MALASSCLVASGGLAAASAQQAFAPGCLVAAVRLDSAWSAFREGRVAEAGGRFRALARSCPRDASAQSGLGYVALRAGDLATARRAFDAALARQPAQYDGLAGRGMVAWRMGDTAATRRFFELALQSSPGDSVALAYLARLPGVIDSTALPSLVRPGALVLAARTGSRRFEVPDGTGGWRPFFLKAVNLGAALPGKFPSQFPTDDSTYERWIALVASVHANAIRVYTIHPPHFYRALAAWNRAHPAAPIWLVHGVWTELPPGKLEEQYDEPKWHAAFLAEMNRVVDVVHGRAAIALRPGHAGGLYLSDVSPWTLGWILGREWEPYSVVAYAKQHPGNQGWQGRFINLRRGNAVERWLARFADSTVAYETSRWNAQRPIAYTNWPTLDPLYHPTEASRSEERALLAKRREVPPEASREYDNDAIGLDGAQMVAGPEFRAGTFASYHAYPYYPDFVQLEPAYQGVSSPDGPSSYFAYLRALVEHHGQMPLVIAEYGVPSSRGVAHLEPQGFHHGGHDEREQGRINARLTREIVAAGCAGLGYFALIDEWFKHNWAVIDFEVPRERNRLWLNVLDAEQHYGLIGMRAGVATERMRLDGRGDDWRGAPWLTGDATSAGPLALRALHVTHDEAYVHLRLDVGAIDWSRGRYLIGVDTYRTGLGDLVLPETRERVNTGLEFVLDLRGPDSAQLLVDAPYDPRVRVPIRGAKPPATMQLYQRPFVTRSNAKGQWAPMVVVSNRRRIGRDGTIYPESGTNWGALRFARSDSSTLADWYADAGTGIIEVRIPWGLLNVTDPSSRAVLFGQDRAGMPDSRVTDGFRFLVRSYDPRDSRVGGQALPARGTKVPTWTWPMWAAPRWFAEEKPQVEMMRAAFRAIPD